MANGGAILATLEAVADVHGDPRDAIYALLFSRHPELEALFWLDRDGGVRAAMLQQALECLIDHAGEQTTSAVIIAAARQHHHGYGVAPDQFDLFFVVMRDAFRSILGNGWTPEMEDAWEALLEELSAIR